MPGVFGRMLSHVGLLNMGALLAYTPKPSKHAGSDPEAVWLQPKPVMAIMASVQPELGRIAYAGSGFPHPFQLCFFPKESMDHIVQN